MKKYAHYIIGLFVMLFSILLVAYSDHASAQDKVPERALTLGSWIEEKSVEWQEQNDLATDLQAQLSAAIKKRDEAATVANSFRKALCDEFNMGWENGEFSKCDKEPSFQ